MSVVDLDKLDSDIAKVVAIVSVKFPGVEHTLDSAYLAIRGVLRESNPRLDLACGIFEFVFYINLIRAYVLGSIDDRFIMAKDNVKDIDIKEYLREIITKLSPEVDVETYIGYVNGYVAQYQHFQNGWSSNYTMEGCIEKPIYPIKYTDSDVVNGANMLGLNDENITLDETSLRYVILNLRALLAILAKTIKTSSSSSANIGKDLLYVIFDHQ